MSWINNLNWEFEKTEVAKWVSEAVGSTVNQTVESVDMIIENIESINSAMYAVNKLSETQRKIKNVQNWVAMQALIAALSDETSVLKSENIENAWWIETEMNYAMAA